MSWFEDKSLFVEIERSALIINNEKKIVCIIVDSKRQNLSLKVTPSSRGALIVSQF